VPVPPNATGAEPLLTPRDLRLLYVVAALGLLAIGLGTARRLGYWPGAGVTVVTVPSTPHPLDLNRAEWWELTELPGIGETRARAIIAARTARGGFRSVQELTDVPGIPPAVAKDLLQQNLVFVDPDREDAHE